jgi:protease YdgD
MLKRFAFIFRIALCTAQSLFAQSSDLTALSSLESGRGWNAVGRLELGGRGFCTGALIAPDIVLTAAHCLFHKDSGAPIEANTIEFLAGLRNGRASAHRPVERIVLHPDYDFANPVGTARVRHDVALLKLALPIRDGSITPFAIAQDVPRLQDTLGVVSYARERAEAPSLQRTCEVLDKRPGVLVTDCNVDFGASGAPMFSFFGGVPKIVSIVSAMADTPDQKVSLGAPVHANLATLMAQLRMPAPRLPVRAIGARRVQANDTTRTSGAKFIRP